MRWKEVEFDKLWVGDIFKCEGSPDRVYQVDEVEISNEHCDISATSFGRKAPGIRFTGFSGPYYRLDRLNGEAIDALATRNAQLQERCRQRDARYSELLEKWEAKREKEQENKCVKGSD